MRPLRSLRARLLLGALVWVVLASLLGGWTLSYAFRTATEDAFDARLTSLVGVLIGLVDVDAQGRLQLARPIGDPQFERVYSGWYWVVENEAGERLRSRSLWDLALEVPSTAVASTPTITSTRDSLGRDIRLAVQRVILPGSSRPATFVVTGDAEVLAAEVRRFDFVLRMALGALGLGLLLAVLLQIRFGLKPLERLAAEVEAVRTGKAERVSPLNTSELDCVVAELNSLIDHNRRIVERARASASDLAHALKTPLAVMGSLDQDGTDAARERQSQLIAMERIVTRHLARTSAAGPGVGSLVPIWTIVDEISRGLKRVYLDRRIDISNQVEQDAVYPADREDLEEMLGNLIENACKWAGQEVRIRSRTQTDELIIVVEDDGPGMSHDDARHAIDRGTRLDEKAPGSGLGLAIVTDLTTLYGGKLELSRSDLGGLRAEVRLPLRERRS